MGSAEQGGNLPQRVLLIGGPKHGDWMNLPSGQTEYRFVGMKMLSPQRSWGDWPDSAEHVYTLDEKLTAAMSLFLHQRYNEISVFSHEVLTTSPEHAGFNLYALRNAEKALSEARDSLKKAEKSTAEQFALNQDLASELTEVEDARDAAENRLQWMRQQLEGAAQLLFGAINLTGVDYVPFQKLTEAEKSSHRV